MREIRHPANMQILAVTSRLKFRGRNLLTLRNAQGPVQATFTKLVQGAIQRWILDFLGHIRLLPDPASGPGPALAKPALPASEVPPPASAHSNFPAASHARQEDQREQTHAMFRLRDDG